MALTGNKGEWSEIYTLFKLLGEKQVYAGDGNLNKIGELFYPILRVLRNEQNHNYQYSIEDEIVIVTEDGTELLRKPVNDFLNQAHELLSVIRRSSGTFASPEAEQFMTEIGCRQIKAKSVEKADIRIVIHDLRTGMTPLLGFSIKSQLGDSSTLLNAGRTTNFCYKIEKHNFTKQEIDAVNNIDTRAKIRDRVQAIQNRGGVFSFEMLEDKIFNNNLILIDSKMPEIIAQLLLEYYISGNSDLKQITNAVSARNPLRYDMSNHNPFYEFKVKQMLVAIALGMVPHTPWNGLYQANGGYLVVKEDGDVLCYHFYDRNLFEDYLYCNTKFETPSTGRHGFGELFTNNGIDYFKLNLQIRFK